MIGMPPALPGGWDYDCGPDKVPGWLNDEGLPTGCVDNNPTPGEPTPEPTVTMPVEPPEAAPEPTPEPDIYPSALPLEPLPDAPPATTEGQVLNPPQVHVRDELAMTGPGDVAGWVFAGVLLVAVGLFVALNEWRKK